MKAIFFSVLMLGTPTIGYSQTFYEEVDKDAYRGQGTIYNRSVLKKLAFCKCVQYYSHADIWRKDASVSLLKETADYDVMGLLYIDSIAKLFVKSMPYSDLTEQKGMLLHCIDFYNSRKLSEIVIYADKYLPKRIVR